MLVATGSLITAPATIANGQSVSSLVNTQGLQLVGILLPPAFTGATVKFNGSIDGTNFYPVKSTTSGTDLSYTVTQGTYAAINPIDFAGLSYIRVVSASAEAAARSLTLALKGM